MFKKKHIQTSKPIMLKPIHIEEKTIIPISVLDIQIVDIKHPFITGNLKAKGAVVIDVDGEDYYSVDEDYDLEEVVKHMPEVKVYFNSEHVL